MPTRRRAIACFVGYWVVLVLLTHWPNPFPGGSEPQHYDKLGHFGLYCVLAALAGEVVLSGRRIGGYPIGGLAARLAVVFVAVVAFGLADEPTQPLTGRDCDSFDWLADCLGATCGVLLAGWRRRGGRNATERVPYR
jgi:VanZ family protein